MSIEVYSKEVEAVYTVYNQRTRYPVGQLRWTRKGGWAAYNLKGDLIRGADIDSKAEGEEFLATYASAQPGA